MERFIKYPEKLEFEKKESAIKVNSDFENETGNNPEIEMCPQKGLLLFDIDGTLVDVKQIHGKAVEDLYSQKFGVKVDRKLWFKGFGLGDFEEHRQLLEHYKIPYSDELILSCMTDYGNFIEKTLSEMSPEDKQKVILPGIIEFLENARKVNLPMGIVTGNTEQNARAIIKHFGLSKYFIGGGFDSDIGPTPPDTFRRPLFLGKSIEHCVEKMGGAAPPLNRIVVIGDTQKDSRATASVSPEIRQILVATGDETVKDLAVTVDEQSGKKPDLVLKQITHFDLFNREQVKELLGEEGYKEYVEYLRKEKRKK